MFDSTNNKIRQLFTTSPINSSIYNNSSNQFDQDDGNIMLSLDGSYLNTVYTQKDADARYPVKAIDGTNTNISLDTKYRIQSDGTNFYIQRLDNDGVIITNTWVNVVSFNWNTNTNTSSIHEWHRYLGKFEQHS